MKKLLSILALAIMMMSCGDSETTYEPDNAVLPSDTDPVHGNTAPNEPHSN
ncbi:hypothetical protein MY04_3702 [Flammeovirga sp. MY04]|uniref:hypothetical protein n=1 Tax=Flammeovirga sp. MY04 TaxID=1191459 RepID=UPI00080620EE|nr:hypothetical protein [Flammeovirga sp. MY04]ANQ51046.1 hypothetical protein MY04_3702 [Flammeovirga sp. MY04]